MAEKKPFVKISPELLCTDKDGYIFISYAHKDAEKVLPIIESLYNAGYRVWFDQGLEVGTEWMNTIATKVSGCSLFLFVYSKNSAKSTYCMDEITYAKTKNKPGLVINLEDSSTAPAGVTMQTNRYTKIDAFGDRDYMIELLAAKELAPCYEGRHSAIAKSKVINCRKTLPVLIVSTVVIAVVAGCIALTNKSEKPNNDVSKTTKAAEETVIKETEGLVYTISDDRTYYIVSDYNNYLPYVTVPDNKDGLPIVIAEESFANNTVIKELTIYCDIDTIYPTYFNGCINLEKITFKGNVGNFIQKSNGSTMSSFENCNSLKSLCFEGNVGQFGNMTTQKIADALLRDLSAFESLTFTKEVGTMASYSIDYESAKCKINFGTKVGVFCQDWLADESLDRWVGIVKVEVSLPNEIGYFASDAFSLIKTTTSGANKYIGNENNPYLVMVSSNNRSVSIPSETKYISFVLPIDNVSDIPESVEILYGIKVYDNIIGNFEVPKAITVLHKDSLDFVRDDTFDLFIPSTVIEIEDGVQSAKWNSISVAEDSKYFYIRDDCLIERENERLIAVFGTTVAEGVKSIDENAFVSKKS